MAAAAVENYDTAALAAVERLRRGIDAAHENNIWGGIQELLQLPHLELANPLQVFHGLMAIVADAANEWMDRGVKFWIAEMFVRLSHACFVVSVRHGYFVRQQTKDVFEESLRSCLRNVDETKRPENGLRYRLECSLAGALSLNSNDLRTLLRLQSSQVLTVLAQLAKQVFSLRGEGGIDLVGIASAALGNPEGIKAILQTIVAIGDFAREEFQRRWYLGVIEIEGLVAVSLATGRGGGAAAAAAGHSPSSAEAWHRLKQVLYATKTANWHIVYAGVCGLEKIVSSESSRFRSEAWKLLKSYATFKDFSGFSSNNWRIREKVLEACILLQKSLAFSTHPLSRQIRREANSVLVARAVVERNPRVHLLLAHREHVLAVHEAWRKSWPRQKGEVEQALDAQKQELEELKQEMEKAHDRQPALEERFAKLQEGMNGQLTRLEGVGAQIGTNVDQMRGEVADIARVVCQMHLELQQLRAEQLKNASRKS